MIDLTQYSVYGILTCVASSNDLCIWSLTPAACNSASDMPFWDQQQVRLLPLQDAEGVIYEVTALEWARDGRGIIIGSAAGTIHLHHLEPSVDARSSLTIRAHVEREHDMTLVDLATIHGQGARTMSYMMPESHRNAVTSLAISTCGRVLASASHDQSVRLWSLVAARCLRVIPAHDDYVTSVCFVADDSIVASASLDGHLYVCMWRGHELRDWRCRRTGKQASCQRCRYPINGVTLSVAGYDM